MGSSGRDKSPAAGRRPCARGALRDAIRRRRSPIEALEPRILLSADLPLPLLLEAPVESSLDSETPLVQELRHEVAFVDAGVEGHEALVDDLRSSRAPGLRLEVHVLDPGRSGLDQMSDILAGREASLDAVHVVSHGTEHGLRLGDEWLTNERLAERSADVAGWKGALRDDADLLLYGCNLASSGEGRALVERLADLTGADVAASDDLTGSEAIRADWELEYASGEIETPIALTSAIRESFVGPLDGTAIWADEGESVPQTRDLNGATFGPEGTTVDVGGEWRVIAGAEATTRDEKLVVGVNESGKLDAMVWDGTTWNDVAPAFLTLGTIANTELQSFDVAYETFGGDAVFAYNNGFGLIGYSVWNGTDFSFPFAVPQAQGGSALQIEMASNPNSDEIIAVVSNSSNQVYASIWNGSSWTGSTHFPNGDSSVDVTDINIVYEQQSGHAMVVYGDDTTRLQTQIWDGTSWTGGSLDAPAGVTGEVRWTDLSADPTSDRIVLGVGTEDKESWFAVWDGNGWEAPVQGADTEHKDRREVGVAFESGGGQAVAAYGTTSNDVRFRTWTAGGGWSGEAVATTLGAHVDVLTLDADPQSDAVMLSIVDQQKDVSFTIWDGSSWGANNEFETDAGTNRGQPFLFLWDVPDTGNSAPVLDGSGDMSLGNVAQDDPDPAGKTVAQIIASAGGDRITDLDPGDLEGIAVIGVDDANGTWQYSVDGGSSWLSFVAGGVLDGGTDDTQSILLGEDDLVRFVPAPTYTGSAGSVSFRAWDQSDGLPAGMTGVDASVTGGSTAFSTATESFDAQVVTVQERALWFSTRDDISDGGTPGVNSWTEGEILELAGGAFSIAFDLDAFVADGDADIDAIHLVQNDITLGSANAVGLLAGDLLLSTNNSEVVGGLAVTSGAVFVFRPDGPSYDSGSFLYLLDSAGFGGGDIEDFALVEQATTVGGMALSAGSLILGDGAEDIVVFTPTDVGAGTTTGTLATLVEGLDIGLEAGNEFRGIELIHTPTEVNGVLLDEGSLLVSLRVNGLVGDNALNVKRNDVLVLDVTQAGSDSEATASFVLDGSSLGLGGGDESVRPIGLAPLNTAPTLTPGAPTLTTITEDDVANPGDLVSDILSGLVSDPDAGSVTGLAVTGLSTGNGVWEFSTDGGGVWNAVGAVSNTSALLLRDVDRIRYVPDGLDADSADFSFRAWDQTDGLPGDLHDTSTNGGFSAFSANTDVAHIDVLPVNDAPVGADNTVSTLEDAPYVFQLADFGFDDPVEGHGFQAIQLAGLVGAGTLTNGGVVLTGVELIDAADIAAGDLVFTPAPDANGAAHGGFSFQVQDSGGTANGGVDLDPVARLMTVDVTSVNDEPSGSDATIVLLEDDSHTFGIADFGFGDAADGDSLAAIVITTAPGAGTLRNGATVLAGGETVTVAQILAGDLVYTPDPDDNGTAHASFTFQVMDDGGTANGGVELDATPNTIQLDVTPVNDAPDGTDATIVMDEDSSHVFGVADFGFDDALDGDSLASVVISTAPGAGTLRNGATVLTGGETVTVAQILAGDLVFTPDPGDSGVAYASFTFQVRDDGGTANGGIDLDPTPNTIQLDVTSINDAPDGTDATIALLEDGAHVFGVADFGFSDADGDSLAAVVITTAPGAGTLRNGATTLTGGETVTVAQILAGDLVFTPDPDDNGVGYASFGFQVKDDGGTANGGVDLDATPNTIQLDVTPVNDVPAGTDVTVTTGEDTGYVFTVADFGLNDPLDGDALLEIVVTTAPAAGTLTNGVTVLTGGETVSAAAINAGDLVFTPLPGENGVGYASFDFQVRDTGGTANGGVDLDPTPNTVTIDVTAVNNAPSGADATLNVLEDVPYTFALGDFGFSDPADGHSLLAVEIGVVAGAGTFRDGALVLTGGETVTAGSIASGNLTYTPVPGASGAGQATLTFQVRDSGGTANGGVDLDPTPNTLTLDVLAVNDAPSGSDDNITILEDGAHTLTLGDFGFSDGDGNALASVVITTAPGAGTLRNGATVLTGGETVTRAQILAGDLVYTAPPDANGPSLASFGFQVVDDGGTANGGVDTDPTANTIDFDVTAVNDEPSGTDATCTLLEDGSHTFGVADFGFSDVVEGDSLSGVFITTVPGAGTLRNGASVLAGGETVTVAQILAGDLVYTPAPDDNGVAAASFTFQVIDDGGTANGGVDMDSTPNTIQLDITPVNDAPSGTDSNVVLLEDGSHVFAVGDFAITDPEGHGLSAVVITTAPGAGTLRNGATVLTGGETVTGAQIAAGDLVYTPAPGASGVGASSFTFQVVDDGGTANGGVDTDPTANTMRLDVTAVNDAPSGTDRTISLLEDASHTFGTADFGFGDTDGNALAGVVITTAPGAGTLRNGATTLTGGETVTLAQILAGDVVYTPDPDDNGTGLASFTFQVIDDGGVANGGVDTDPTPNTIQLDVAPVNDAPSGTDTTLSLSEDGSLTFGLSDFGFSDAIDGDAFAAVRIASGPTDGTLRNGAIVLTGGETVTATSIAAGDLVFTPDADESGLGYASFGFQVRDDGGVANGGVDLDPTVNTVTLDVLAANDAPVLASASPNLTAINENATGNAGQTVASVVGASITDSDPAPSEGVALTRIASSGGTWQYSTNGGGSWNVVGAVSDASALLLRDSDRIRFVPDAQNGETASFDFRAWDQTSGVFGTHANTTTNGGATAFSTSDNRATISVASVNDAPGLGNATMPSIEAGTTDPAGASVAALFGGRFSDVDAGSSMSGVAVIGNAAAAAQGVWQYSTDGGASWSSVGAVGDGVNALAISSATRLRFVPAAGFSGTPSALAVRALDDAYPGTFSTAGVAETRILVDTSAPGGSSAVSGSAASLAIDVTEAPGGSEEEEPEGETALPPTIDEEPPLSSPEVQEDPEIEVAAEPEGVDAATEASPDPVDLTGIAPRIVPTVDWGDPSPRVVSQGLPVVEVGEAREATPEEIERLDDRREPPTLASFGSSPSERIREFFRGLKDDLGFLNPETGFASELERLEEVRIEQARLEQTVVGSSVAMSAGLSIGYLVWLTRGGLLIASMASSIPVWRLVDPIPVLASLALGETDEDDAESLDSMLRESAGDGRPEAPETPTVRP